MVNIVLKATKDSAFEQKVADFSRAILPYFGKKKQVTYHLNLSYWFFYFLFYFTSMFFFQAKFYASTLILF